jgi:hypothetical protein
LTSQDIGEEYVNFLWGDDKNSRRDSQQIWGVGRWGVLQGSLEWQDKPVYTVIMGNIPVINGSYELLEKLDNRSIVKEASGGTKVAQNFNR